MDCNAGTGGWIGIEATADDRTVLILASAHVWPVEIVGFPDMNWPLSKLPHAKALAVELDMSRVGENALDTWLSASITKAKIDKALRGQVRGHVLKSLKTSRFKFDSNETERLLASHPLKIFQLLSCDGVVPTNQAYRSLDQELLQLAKSAGLKVVELETFDEQARWLTGGISFDWRAALLSLPVDRSHCDENRALNLLRSISGLYGAGKVDRILSLTSSPAHFPWSDQSYHSRNSVIADRIDDYSKTIGSMIVVIGLRHLFGDRSVPELLHAKGYETRLLD
jgi:uncharacterized protein YbaP (TraB family)